MKTPPHIPAISALPIWVQIATPILLLIIIAACAAGAMRPAADTDQ